MLKVSKMTEEAKATADLASGGITLGAFFDAIPEITALIALVWWLLRIYESPTVQKALGKLRD